MKLIEITQTCYVASDLIAEVIVNDASNSITVRMKNGVGHSVHADYGKGIFATVARLVAEINKAEEKA